MNDFEYQESLHATFCGDILTFVVVEEEEGWFIPYLFGDSTGSEWQLDEGCDNLKEAISIGKKRLIQFTQALKYGDY